MLPKDVSVSIRTVETGAGPLPVAILDPPGETDRTFIVAMGYAAWLEDFELQRFRLLAHQLRARLVVVETPGHGTTGSHLTAAERWALLTRSDFSPVASRMLDAAAAADPTVLTAPVGVLGYSLGSSVGTAIARALHARTGHPATALILVEPVAGRPWRPRDLLRASGEEDGFVDVALAQNDQVAGAVPPWDRRPGAATPQHKALDLLFLANALRAGRLARQIVQTHADRVIIVRGKDSRLSKSAAVADIVDQVRAAGLNVNVLVMLGTHALWHSLPSVQRLGMFVTDTLDGAE